MAGAEAPEAEELAVWVEDSVRGILRDAALGEIDTDLNQAADESLIANGLDSGDSQIAVSEQVEPEPEPEPIPEWEPTPQARQREHREEEPDMEQDTRILEPVPAEEEIRITATDWLEEVEEDDRVEAEEATLDFPSVQGDLERRERIDTPRVRHLFPVPEDADWEVKELDYTHYTQRRTG